MIVAVSYIGVYGPFEDVGEARAWTLKQKYPPNVWTIRRLNPVTHSLAGRVQTVGRRYSGSRDAGLR